MNSDSKMLLDKINKYFRDIEIKKLGSWTSQQHQIDDPYLLKLNKIFHLY